MGKFDNIDIAFIWLLTIYIRKIPKQFKTEIMAEIPSQTTNSSSPFFIMAEHTFEFFSIGLQITEMIIVSIGKHCSVANERTFLLKL